MCKPFSPHTRGEIQTRLYIAELGLSCKQCVDICTDVTQPVVILLHHILLLADESLIIRLLL